MSVYSFIFCFSCKCVHSQLPRTKSKHGGAENNIRRATALSNGNKYLGPVKLTRINSYTNNCVSEVINWAKNLLQSVGLGFLTYWKILCHFGWFLILLNKFSTDQMNYCYPVNNDDWFKWCAFGNRIRIAFPTDVNAGRWRHTVAESNWPYLIKNLLISWSIENAARGHGDSLQTGDVSFGFRYRVVLKSTSRLNTIVKERFKQFTPFHGVSYFQTSAAERFNC